MLTDTIELKSEFESEETAPTAPKVAQSQHIRLELRPGQPFDDGDYTRETTFSMFDPDRVIKSFDLNIPPERCNAWGWVSSTSEIDFRLKTDDDIVGFDLYVTPDTFAPYGAKIAHDLVSEVILSVRSVEGFYSEWSPRSRLAT